MKDVFILTINSILNKIKKEVLKYQLLIKLSSGYLTNIHDTFYFLYSDDNYKYYLWGRDNCLLDAIVKILITKNKKNSLIIVKSIQKVRVSDVCKLWQ